MIINFRAALGEPLAREALSRPRNSFILVVIRVDREMITGVTASEWEGLP